MTTPQPEAPVAAPEGITENFSEKPKRGRPRVLDDEYVRIMRGIGCFESRVRRSNINEHFRMHAVGALLNHNPDGMDAGKAEFAYLIHPATEKMKATILTELGRLKDPDTIRACARVVCDQKMHTRKAVVRLRSVRAKPKTGYVLDLCDELIAVVNDFLLRHPEFTFDQALDAIEQARYMIENHHVQEQEAETDMRSDL
jgi:hypothetical protein